MPIPAGQIDAAVGQLDALATALLDSSHVPGMSVAVVHDGKTLYSKGFGVRSVDTEQPVDADTVFALAGVSEPVSATVVARELGQQAAPATTTPNASTPSTSTPTSTPSTSGPTAPQAAPVSELSWDTPVRQLLPTFTLANGYVSDNATIGDLFAHRAGLPERAGDLAADLGYDRQQLLARLPFLPLAPFRDSFASSGFGLTAAAEAVAQSAGVDWATLAQRSIYSPLAMASTSSRSADFLARTDRAVGHVLSGGKYIAAATPGPATIGPATTTPAAADALAPAEGVSSSANDMARWMAMVLANGAADGRQLIESGDLLPALSPQAVTAPPATADSRSGSYGFGFTVDTSAAGRVELGGPGSDLSSVSTSGASAALTLIPSANVGIVVLTNAAPVGVPQALAAQFADLVQFGKLTQDWPKLASEAAAPLGRPTGALAGQQPPANPAPAAALPSYDGVYNNPFYGPATVTTSNDTLTLTLGPGPVSFPLRHWSGDVFVLTPPVGSAPPGSLSRVVFTDNALTIEYLDDNGIGTFSRR